MSYQYQKTAWTSASSQYRWLLAMVIALLSSTSQAAVNGAALYENYGKDQFLAVLHLPQPAADAAEALQQSDGAIMEYVIAAESISSRAMSRHWLEAAVVNAERAEVEANSDALARLSEMLKGPLLQGDTLKLTAAQWGVEVTLNEVLLGQIAAPGLVPMLLQTWLGPVPPSSSFRADILSAGQAFDELLSRYRDVVHNPNRQAQIEQNWLQESEGKITQPAAQQASAQPTSTPVPDLANRAEPTVAPVTEARPESTLPTEPAPSTQQVAAQVDTQVDTNADAQTPVSETVAQASGDAATAQAPGLSYPDSPTDIDAIGFGNGLDPFSPPASAQPFAQEMLPTEPPATQLAMVGNESALATDEAMRAAREADAKADTEQAADSNHSSLNAHYYDAIKSKIYQQVSYPSIALRNGRESEVALNVAINPNGEVVNVEVSDESRFAYFNKAALQAVESASPFSPPPELLVDNGVYQFKMQVNFRLTPST